MSSTLFKSLVLVGLASSGVVVGLGCGSKSASVNTGPGGASTSPPPGVCPTEAPPPGSPQQIPPNCPPFGMSSADAGASAMPTGTATPTATGTATAAPSGSAALNALLGAVIDPGIKTIAAKAAPNMNPEGELQTGTLQEGGHFGFITNLMGGKCYTIIGFSPTGSIVDLDLTLLAPPLYTVPAGKDSTKDNQPVIGKGKEATCPIVPLAVPYKVDVAAMKGAGVFGVQVYSRAK